MVAIQRYISIHSIESIIVGFQGIVFSQNFSITLFLIKPFVTKGIHS